MNRLERFIATKMWKFRHGRWWMPDRWYVELRWEERMNYPLNLDDPKTYNEKLNWTKLYNRDHLYPLLVDKYRVKKWVAEKIGEQYIIPTLAVYKSVDDIDFASLPNKFVLKCNHDGGNVVICRDKSSLDIEAAKSKLAKALKYDYWIDDREWPYKKVKRCIIAEQYVEDESGDLPDYKFFCFDGVVKAMYVATERHGGGDVKFDYYDADFNHLDIWQYHQMSSKNIPKPDNFELMKKLASILSAGIPHVRVDFYETNGKVYFGEMTFFHHGGIIPFHPHKWDEIFGSWFTLPAKKN